MPGKITANVIRIKTILNKKNWRCGGFKGGRSNERYCPVALCSFSFNKDYKSSLLTILFLIFNFIQSSILNPWIDTSYTALFPRKLHLYTANLQQQIHLYGKREANQFRFL